jgi:hypothetical protein
MITQEVTRRNVRPYLIGLSLILLAFLLVWAANGALQSGGLQVKVGNAPVTTSAVNPADQKYFDAGHMALLMMSGRGDPLANVDPADRKFYTNEYTNSGHVSTAADPLANVDPADRKFYTNGYVTGGRSRVADPLANVDPADRKFFTNEYGSGTP